MKVYTKEQLLDILKKKWIKEFKKHNSKSYFIFGFVDDALGDDGLLETSHFELPDDTHGFPALHRNESVDRPKDHPRHYQNNDDG